MTLSRFREEGDGGAAEWSPQPVESLWTGVVLAFDQSLAATGWVLLDNTSGSVEFVKTGMVHTDASTEGHEGNQARGLEVYLSLNAVLSVTKFDLVVYEMPPTMPPRGRGRTDSVALAGLALRIAARGYPIVMRSAQKAKKRWTDNPNAKKQDVRTGVLALFPALREKRPFNEHVVDAAAIGLLVFEEKKRPW